MIWSVYHVFGSGGAGLICACDPSLTVQQYCDNTASLSKMAIDDGHNGFKGTTSVDTALAHSLGIDRDAWFEPGRGGSVKQEWYKPMYRVQHYRDAIQIGQIRPNWTVKEADAHLQKL